MLQTDTTCPGKKIRLWLLLFFLTAWLLPLFLRPAFRPDEFRYAEIPREMLRSGDWISPRLAGVPYFEKPSPGNWPAAVCMRVFGETMFSARLPQALAGGLTALFLMFFLRKTRPEEPLLPELAAAVYLCFSIVWGVGTFAVLDSLLTLFLTLCTGLCFLALREPDSRKRALLLLLSGMAAGGAFLVKGFLAFAVPAVIFVPYLLWTKQWKRIFTVPFLPLLGAILLSGAWCWSIHSREPDFWEYFFVEEHLMRFTGHTYDRNPQPFWYFMPVLLGGLLPSGLLLLAGCGKGAVSRFRTLILQNRDLICFAAMPFLLFSASSCKLGTYILPCFPALAALTALTFLQGFQLVPADAEHRIRLLEQVWGIVVCIAGVLMIPAVLILKRYFLSASSLAMALLCGVSLILWGGLILRKLRFLPVCSSIFLLLFTGGPALIFGSGGLPEGLLKAKTPETAFRNVLKKLPVSPATTVYADRDAAVPLCWMLDRTDVIVAGRPGELGFAVRKYPDRYGTRHVPDEKDLKDRHGVFILFRNVKRRPPSPEIPALQRVEENGITLIRF